MHSICFLPVKLNVKLMRVFILRDVLLNYYLSNFLKFYHNLFTQLSHKSYSVRHVYRFVRIQPGALGVKLSGGVKVMRRQNNYPAAE